MTPPIPCIYFFFSMATFYSSSSYLSSQNLKFLMFRRLPMNPKNSHHWKGRQFRGRYLLKRSHSVLTLTFRKIRNSSKKLVLSMSWVQISNSLRNDCSTFLRSLFMANRQQWADCDPRDIKTVMKMWKYIRHEILNLETLQLSFRGERVAKTSSGLYLPSPWSFKLFGRP